VHAVLFAPASIILSLCMQCFLPLHQTSFCYTCRGPFTNESRQQAAPPHASLKGGTQLTGHKPVTRAHPHAGVGAMIVKNGLCVCACAYVCARACMCLFKCLCVYVCVHVH
jgi:hypothetical protein